MRPAISLLSLACAALQVPAICYVCKCLYACVHVCMCVCVLVPTCACVRLWCVFLQCQTLTHFCVLHCTPSTVGVALVNWRFSQQMWAYFYRHPTMQTRQIVCVRVCVMGILPPPFHDANETEVVCVALQVPAPLQWTQRLWPAGQTTRTLLWSLGCGPQCLCA